MGKAWLAVALVGGLLLLPGCGEPEAGAPETREATPAPGPPEPAPAPATPAKPGTGPEASTPSVAPPPTSETAPEIATSPEPAPSPPAAPGLDLEGLERRLKETSALGVLTKLSLKNEIDDLLEDVGRFHHKQKGDLPSLRERFDLLLLKVTSLLQDDEPELAREIADAREGLWRLLADPAEFAKLSA